MKFWSEVADLRFLKGSKNQTVDIDIRFELKSHGDDDAFDGPGGTYGHAFFPYYTQLSGDIHFDDAEEWTLKTNKGWEIMSSSERKIIYD